LVMRLLRGGSLAQVIQETALDLEQTARVLDQIGSAMNLAHRSEVIHRDLKPANILLDEEHNAYLSDFGIAKDIRKANNGSTEPDLIVGSPDYITPEQIRSEAVTPQTDI